MGSFLARVLLCAFIAVAVLIAPGSGIGHAQPGPGASAPSNAAHREAARKLVNEGIAAQDAGDYDRAVALYMRAFALDPHPVLLFNVGQAHRLDGCPERAASFYERYLALEPRGSQAPAARAALDEISRAGKTDGPGCATAFSYAEPAERHVVSTGQLKLSSVPEGVMVMIDGTKVGVTPLERELAAGSHTIVLVDRGMLVGESKVEVFDGDVLEMTIPVEYPASAAPQRGPSRVAPVLLWAGGGLALAGSGVAFYYGQKGGPDHPEDPYIYRGATTTGYVLAGAGAAAISAGVWLWVRGSRESAPIVSIGPGGGQLGWQGRF
jgi:tetratricopeptide (TPR) repeat protein